MLCIVWFALLGIARCSLLMNDLVILLPNSQFSHIFMFEAIEWHFMHVICDVYLNVYLFITAAAAIDPVVIVIAVGAFSLFTSIVISYLRSILFK